MNNELNNNIIEFQPYTYHRIVRILKDGNIYLDPIVWYKCKRIPNYKQHYNVKLSGTNEIIGKNLSLNDLRKILTDLDYPLKVIEAIKKYEKGNYS